jgi:putative sigma-54 modulation protein
MVIKVHGKGMKIGSSLQEKVEKKLAKFHRFFDDDTTAQVKMQPEKNDLRVEVTINVRGQYYRAEAIAQDAIIALEHAIDNMERQIRRHKTKIKKQTRSAPMHAYLQELPPLEESLAPDASEPQIIRRKSFTISPMNPEEAVLQMELLGHSFLLYIDDETEKVCLVYKRHDGNYGLIEPEY